MRMPFRRTLFILSLAALMVGLAFTPVLAAVNQIVWKKFYSDDGVMRMAADKNGNVILVGIASNNHAFVRKRSGGGRTLWYRESSISKNPVGFLDVAVDADGYIYVSGMIGGDQSVADTEAGRFFISKYGPRGGHHWTRKLPTDPRTTISGIDVGPGGNIYITGDTFGALPNMLRSSFFGDVYIRKYNPDGKIFWTRQFSLNDFTDTSGAFDVAVGPGGGVYVVGTDDSGNGQIDNLVLKKFSPRGGTYWTRRVTRIKSSYVWEGRLAVDRAGDVTVAGNTSVPDGTWGEVQILTVKYTHKGKRLWTRIWDAHRVDDITVDRDRNVYIVGSDMIDLEAERAVVRKYSAAGTRRWTRYFANGYAESATTDSSNNLYVTGWGGTENSPSLLVKFRQ